MKADEALKISLENDKGTIDRDYWDKLLNAIFSAAMKGETSLEWGLYGDRPLIPFPSDLYKKKLQLMGYEVKVDVFVGGPPDFEKIITRYVSWG